MNRQDKKCSFDAVIPNYFKTPMRYTAKLKMMNICDIFLTSAKIIDCGF